MSGRDYVSEIEVDSLTRMTMAELRALWPKVMGRAAPPVSAQRKLLTRELAWRLQEMRSNDGGFDRETQQLLNAAIRAAVKQHALPPDAAPPRSSARRRAATLPSASRLVRVYRGVKHEVIIADGGKAFSYRGESYRSLTAIARQITGSECSGPKFFGLTTRARAKTGEPS